MTSIEVYQLGNKRSSRDGLHEDEVTPPRPWQTKDEEAALDIFTTPAQLFIRLKLEEAPFGEVRQRGDVTRDASLN